MTVQDASDEIEGDIHVGRALMLNALVLTVCLCTVVVVADANWPAHMGSQDVLIDRVMALVFPNP